MWARERTPSRTAGGEEEGEGVEVFGALEHGRGDAAGSAAVEERADEGVVVAGGGAAGEEGGDDGFGDGGGLVKG